MVTTSLLAPRNRQLTSLRQTSQREAFVDLAPQQTSRPRRAWDRAPVPAHAPRHQGHKIWKRVGALTKGNTANKNLIEDKENYHRAEVELEAAGAGSRKKMRGVQDKVDLAEAQFGNWHATSGKGLEAMQGANEMSIQLPAKIDGENALQFVPRKRTNERRIVKPRMPLQEITNEMAAADVPDTNISMELEKPLRRTKSMRRSLRSSLAHELMLLTPDDTDTAIESTQAFEFTGAYGNRISVEASSSETSPMEVLPGKNGSPVATTSLADTVMQKAEVPDRMDVEDGKYACVANEKSAIASTDFAAVQLVPLSPATPAQGEKPTSTLRRGTRTSPRKRPMPISSSKRRASGFAPFGASPGHKVFPRIESSLQEIKLPDFCVSINQTSVPVELGEDHASIEAVVSEHQSKKIEDPPTDSDMPLHSLSLQAPEPQDPSPIIVTTPTHGPSTDDAQPTEATLLDDKSLLVTFTTGDVGSQELEELVPDVLRDSLIVSPTIEEANSAINMDLHHDDKPSSQPLSPIMDSKAEQAETTMAVDSILASSLSPQLRSCNKTARFDHDDTDMLRDFLCKVKANKAAKAAIKRKKSLPHSPIQIPLAETEGRISPTPNEVSTDIIHTHQVQSDSASPSKKRRRVVHTAKDGPEDSEGPSSTTPVRRSTRTRLPVVKVPSNASMAPSLIPVRLESEQDITVTLRKSEDKELAVLTKVNTRKNKGSARSVHATLDKWQKDMADPAFEQTILKETALAEYVRPLHEKLEGKRRNRKGQNVEWAEMLVQCRGEPVRKTDSSSETGPAAKLGDVESASTMESKLPQPRAKGRTPTRSCRAPKDVLELETAPAKTPLPEQPVPKTVKVGVRSKIALGMAANGTPAPKRRVRSRV